MRPIRFTSSFFLNFIASLGHLFVVGILVYIYLTLISKLPVEDGELPSLFVFIMIGYLSYSAFKAGKKALHAKERYIEISSIGFIDTRILRSIIPWQFVRKIHHHKTDIFRGKEDLERIIVEVKDSYLDHQTHENLAELLNTESIDGWAFVDIYSGNLGHDLGKICDQMLSYQAYAAKRRGDVDGNQDNIIDVAGSQSYDH